MLSSDFVFAFFLDVDSSPDHTSRMRVNNFRQSSRAETEQFRSLPDLDSGTESKIKMRKSLKRGTLTEEQDITQNGS